MPLIPSIRYTTDDGENAKTDLTPLFSARNLATHALVVDQQPMTHIGSGIYTYLWNTYDPDLVYGMFVEADTTDDIDQPLSSYEVNASFLADLETSLGSKTAADQTLANTNRVDGLIEDVDGDRYTAKALEQAPSPSGTLDSNVVSVDGVPVTGPDDLKSDATLANQQQIIADVDAVPTAEENALELLDNQTAP